MRRSDCCLFCSRKAVVWHHVTGCRSKGPREFLDRCLVVPLCQRHHAREHELLRRDRTEFPQPGADLVGHRLARLVALIGRCGDHGRPLVLEPVTPYGNAVDALNALLIEAWALACLGEVAP